MKAPDRSKPRNRQKVGSIFNPKNLKNFTEKYPEHDEVTLNMYRDVIKSFHTNIRAEVFKNPFGVVLPSKLGVIILRKCATKKPKVDYNTSIQYGKTIFYKQLDTDGYSVSISYLNNIDKCIVKNKTLLYFKPVRSFKQDVSSYFRENWEKVLQAPNKIKNLLNV